MNIKKVFEIVNKVAGVWSENNLLHLCLCALLMVLFDLIIPVRFMAAGFVIALSLFKEIANIALAEDMESYLKQMIVYVRLFFNLFGTAFGCLIITFIEKHYGVG